MSVTVPLRHGRGILAWFKWQPLLARRGGEQRAFCAGGGRVLAKGKHSGVTFEECLARDPQYCRRLLTRAATLSSEYGDFVAFLQSRLEAPESAATEPAPAESAPPRQAHSAGATAPAADRAGASAAGAAAGAAARASVAEAAGAQAGGEASAQAAPDGRTILAFGKLRGKTFEEAVRCDLRYCRWFLESAQKDPDASAECSENFAAFLAYLGPALGRIGSASSYCPPANAAEGIDLASGSWPVEFGKHKGLSFKELYERDGRYCQWVLNQALHAQKQPTLAVSSFLVYVQYRLLREGRTDASFEGGA